MKTDAANPPKVETSYEETLKHIEWLSSIDLSTTAYSPQLITAAIQYCLDLKRQFEAGEIRSHRDQKAGRVRSLSDSNDSLAKPDEEIKKASLPKEFTQADPISISRMDWDALQQVIPFGSITPPTPGEFYIAQELKLPIHCGFVRNTTHSEQLPDMRQIISISEQCPHAHKDSSAVHIQFRRTMTRLIPVPVGCAITGIDNESSRVLAPKPTDPLVWQKSDYFDDIAYSIRASKEPAFTTIDLEAFYPSKKEQAYFRSKMPLPADLRAEILRNPDDTLALIAGYLAKKSSSGGTNFRYVCNPYLSDFLQANKDYLTLIVHELKVGHCDLLAWYAAAQLRAYGRPAWVASGLVTTPDGSAFNGAYGHSVVITADARGMLIQYDPTATIEKDLGYHPEVLDQSDIVTLDNEFARARTVKQKQTVLRNFSKLIEDKRPQALAIPEVIKDLASLRLSFLRALSNTRNQLDNTPHKFEGGPVSWSALPTGSSLAEIRQVISELVTDTALRIDFATNSVGMHDLGDATRSQREQKQWLLGVLRAHRFQLQDGSTPITETSLRGCFSLADYYSSEDRSGSLWINYTSRPSFSTENIASILGVLDRGLNEFSINGLERSNLQSVELEDRDLPERVRRLLTESRALSEYRNGYLGAKESIYFLVKMQQALLSPTKRRSFLSEAKSDESLLRDFVDQEICLHAKKTKLLTHARTVIAGKPKKEAFYLHPDDIRRLENNIIRAIKRMDIRQTTGTAREQTQTRPYSPGDDTRRIDWKVWARTDKFYVRSLPDTTQGISSPIFVIFGDSGVQWYGRLEYRHYIAALQKEVKRSGREIFVGTLRSDQYFKVYPDSNPEALLDHVYSHCGPDTPHPFRMNSKTGPRNSGNFMIISPNFTEIACLQYLASKQPRTILHYIHTKEPEFQVYPLLKDEWVEKGQSLFPED